MRASRILVPLALGALLAATNAGETDVLVWQTTEDGHKTSWVEVTDGAAKVLRTRAEAVASDGKKLWACVRPKPSRRRWKPCVS